MAPSLYCVFERYISWFLEEEDGKLSAAMGGRDDDGEVPSSSKSPEDPAVVVTEQPADNNVVDVIPEKPKKLKKPNNLLKKFKKPKKPKKPKSQVRDNFGIFFLGFFLWDSGR